MYVVLEAKRQRMNASAVIIADDQPVVVAGVEAAIRKHRYDIVARVNDTDSFLAVLEYAPCDIVITDIYLPEGAAPDGIALIRHIRTRRPEAGIVVLTQQNNAGVLRTLLDMGVAALYDKRSSLRDMPMAVHAAEMGRSYLSPSIRKAFREADCADASHDIAMRLSARELDVLRAYARGMKLQEVADDMHRSVKTISRQKRSAMRKLGLGTEAQFYQYLSGINLGALDEWISAAQEEEPHAGAEPAPVAMAGVATGTGEPATGLSLPDTPSPPVDGSQA